MKHSKYIQILMIWATALLAGPAVAGFDITRMTTVVDDLGGSYTVTKSGRLADAQFSGTSLTEFTNFHPGSGEQQATLNGTLSKTVSRSEQQRSTLSDGAFTLTTADDAWDVSFVNLSVVVTEAGVELAGEVTVNEETFVASELPDVVGFILRRVFWLTRR